MDEQLTRLHARLDEIERIESDEWLAALTPRGKAELTFHDQHRDRTAVAETMAKDTYEQFYGNRKYYSAIQRSLDYTYDWIAKNARGKVVLDYACGDGNIALKAAEAGAQLAIGIDISRVSVNNGAAEAKRRGLTNVRFVQSNAEDTHLDSESIDTILCLGMLHHLDLSYAFPELRRILKVGGRILAGEALDYNPAIKLYRKLTPQMRTEWEKAHILSLKDLTFARRFFDVGEIKFWHPTAYIGGKFPSVLPMLDRLDRVLEKTPLLQLMAWTWTFELIRPEKS